MFTTAVDELVILFLFLLLGAVLRNVIKPLRSLFLPSGLIGGALALILGPQIEISTDIEEDVLVQSDAELLTLVWNNLFSNAMKFTEPGGSVSLTLKTDGPFAIVSVSDTGCGISPEVGAHIFEKFYQGDTSHATQGNGLGLALVKRVVDIVGGRFPYRARSARAASLR